MPAPRGDKWETDIERKLEQLRLKIAHVFYGTPIRPMPNRVVQSDDFDGDVLNLDPGTKGWALSPDNAAFGTIALRNGIVGNDALTNPVAPGVVWADLHNFGLSTTLTNKLTSTITVPAGFTTAAVSVVGRCFVYNPNTTGGYDGAGGDYLFAQTNVAGYNGNTLPLAMSGSNGSATAVSPFSTVLPGLTPGGSFTVQMAASTYYASVAADPGNTIELSGSILWFR